MTAVSITQVMPFDRSLHKKFRDAVFGACKPDVMGKAK